MDGEREKEIVFQLLFYSALPGEFFPHAVAVFHIGVNEAI